MTVTVLTKPACVQCKATYRALDSASVTYDSIDLTQDQEALAQAKELGYLQAPIVLVTEGDTIVDHWSGFRPDKISAITI